MESIEIINAISRLENLKWAWQKVQKYYSTEAAWKDEAEIADFELNLNDNLLNIAKSFQAHHYTLSSIKPIPQPKKINEDGERELRQLFWVSVQDQVAWMAIVNIIGPLLDNKMPVWSFGNRLHRSVWFEAQEDGKNVLRIGPYRHSTGILYRRFSQSWPLYRRYVYLTLRHMAKKKHAEFYLELDDAEKQILEIEENSPASQKMPYLLNDYWKSDSDEIYWASIDFKKFYPNLKMVKIQEQILKNLLISKSDPFNELLNSMMSFPVDYEGLYLDLNKINLSTENKFYDAIPTGLMVGGFLANVAMLEIDQALSNDTKDAQIAHFRYVDDHILLASSFKDLTNWINKYESILERTGIAIISEDKTAPKDLQKFLKGDKDYFEKAVLACKIDPIYPKPLMTKTLARVSELSKLDFEFSDENEQLATLTDLELLLLADIADTEIPETTRVSFAATLISRFSAVVTPSKHQVTNIAELNRKIHKQKILEQRILDILQKTDSKTQKKELSEQIANLRLELEGKEKEFGEIQSKISLSKQNRLSKSYALLLKAIHENPEKLRLWQRAVDFCLATGYKGLGKLQEELQRIKNTCLTTAQYIEALLISDLSGKVVKALAILQYESLSRDSKLENLAFLIDTISTLQHWSDANKNPYYLIRSKKLLGLSLAGADGALKLLIENDYTQSLAPFADSFFRNRRHLFVFNRRNNFTEPPSSAFQANWLWWTESISKFYNSIEPTYLWAYWSANLDPDCPSSWTLWLKYPTYLPHVAAEAILTGEKTFNKGYEGWLIDAFYERLIGSLGDQPQFPDQLRKVIRASQHGQGISLYEWTKWINSQSQKSTEFDPRFGEWTALEIIRQLIVQLNSPREHSLARSLPINPANIVVPESWQNLKDIKFITKNEIPTWESWKGFVKTQSPNLILTTHKQPIFDYRFYPELEGEFLPDLGWLNVRAVGLILLGLLRKDFCWPATWNVPDHAPVLDSAIKKLIGELPCSSLTTSILEACLLPRNRETFLLMTLQKEINFESDTTNDAAVIDSLYDLHDHILNSQAVLETHQYSVQAHKPKQLVPLRIEQLPRFGNDLTLQEDNLND